MKRTKKYFALLLALLLLTALLSGCASKKCAWCGKSFSGAGHDTGAGYVCDDCYNSLSGGTGSSSKSNTGVWIAVTVMVFIAVFSATSGVVYLVLQKVLPPEKPASRRARVREEDYDDEPFQAPRPAAPRSSPAPRPSGSSGEWICPRDRSRNSGPYCAVCGSNRPTAPQRPQNPQQSVHQSPARPQGPGSFARPQQTQQPTRPQQTPARPQQTAPVRPQQPAAPAYQRPAQQPADWGYTPQPEQAPAPEKAYQGRFARRETPQEPEEVDSELLAAIFREAAEGKEE